MPARCWAAWTAGPTSASGTLKGATAATASVVRPTISSMFSRRALTYPSKRLRPRTQ